MPPRHGKTFMGSICLSAWILAHDASAKILVLSYGQDLADKIVMPFVRSCRAIGLSKHSTPGLPKIEVRLWTF
jgi:hypothetical protein